MVPNSKKKLEAPAKICAAASLKTSALKFLNVPLQISAIKMRLLCHCVNV